MWVRTLFIGGNVDTFRRARTPHTLHPLAAKPPPALPDLPRA
jgi:hypothetical protein